MVRHRSPQKNKSMKPFAFWQNSLINESLRKYCKSLNLCSSPSHFLYQILPMAPNQEAVSLKETASFLSFLAYHALFHYKNRAFSAFSPLCSCKNTISPVHRPENLFKTLCISPENMSTRFLWITHCAQN